MRTTIIRYLIVISSLLGYANVFGTPAAPFIDEPKDGMPWYQIDTGSIPNATPRYEPKSMLGNPKTYRVGNQDYDVLDSSHGYSAIGTASWYGTKFHGRRTSSGETYNMYAMTAASPDLPLPSYVKVTNLNNNKQIIVRVNDRGPFHKNRLIDLSYVAAKKLGMLAKGTAPVRVEAIDVMSSSQPIRKRHVYLQAGVFTHLANAKRELTRLKNKLFGAPLRLQHHQRGTKTLYKIMVGPVHSATKHHQWLQQLQLAGIDTAYPVML